MTRLAAILSVTFMLLGTVWAQSPPPPPAAPSRASRAGPIAGRVVADDTGMLVANPRVTTIPALPGSLVVQADADGRFVEFKVPLPGAYYVAAVRRLPAAGTDSWQDPQSLDSLVPRAEAIALGDGETRAIRLTVE